MKKLFYLISLLLLSPGIIFAKANYVRSFANPPVSSSIVIDIAVNNYDEDINCGGLKFWGVQAIEHKTGNRFFGNPRFVSSKVVSQTFILDLPTGNYEEMTFICSENGEDEAFQFGSIENDLAGDQVIFSAPTIPAPVIQENEDAFEGADGDIPAPVIQDSTIPTIDIIDSGATLDIATTTETATSTPTPAPVIQESEDGSTTLIAI